LDKENLFIIQETILMNYYAGIGSRNTPSNIQSIMREVASKLETIGYVLRSGGAIGADSAFESGIINPNNKEIYYAKDATIQAIELAKQFHPAWNKCSPYVQQLHGRNSMILLGNELDKPVNFVICYTEDGKDSGGTGLGIRIANHYKIPVFNLHDVNTINRLNIYLHGDDIL